MISVVRQRAGGDCGVAAIATLLSETHAYEDVFLAAASIDKARKGKQGMRLRELLAVAKRVGLELKPARSYDLDSDTGVLVVHGSHTARDGHCVAVRYRLLWDPADGYAHPWRDYQTRHEARFGTMLRL